jgi:3-oxoacyl-[acyl-carrier-protein] synthase-3
MATFKIDNVRIAGISACVPKTVIENNDSLLFDTEEEKKKYIKMVGVERRHVVDNKTCSSDMCFEAAEKLLSELEWKKEEVECLIFVTQTPDYKYPASACILQNRLGLSLSCMAFDISMSCPGWIYGLSVVSSLVSAGKIRKALLLVGETVTKLRSPYDKVNLISGDAGTATALEYSSDAKEILFDLNTKGDDFKAVWIRDGGGRNPFNSSSLDYVKCEDGIVRNGIQTYMDGASIFGFAIKRAPESIRRLMDTFSINPEQVDYFLLHQANKMINDKIIKKLKLSPDKFPSNIRDYGNTSSTAIPLMIVCKMSDLILEKNNVACGFGGGLSYASTYFHIDNNTIIPKLIIL